MLNPSGNEPQVPSLHDWEILGVNVSRFTRKAEIILYSPDKDTEAVLRLNGVQRFFLSEMMLQNVILDVQLFDEINDSDYLERGLRLLGMESFNFGQEKGLKLIYFEPSVGAELTCCFSEFEFIEIKRAGNIDFGTDRK